MISTEPKLHSSKVIDKSKFYKVAHILNVPTGGREKATGREEEVGLKSYG